MKIGFIGIGNQAKALIKIIRENFKKTDFVLFCHRKNLCPDVENIKKVNELKDLLNCDAIFIASNNETHFKYLNYFIQNYKGYIFVEKPPVTNKNELEFLCNIDEDIKKRIYFNFNYRFSDYIKSLNEDSKKYNLGKLINATIIQGHGLAFKPSYEINWRSKKEIHKKGIFETFSIHFYDMFIYLFGKPLKYFELATNRSTLGNSFDNSNFVAQFKNNITLNLVVSYTCPCVNRLTFIYENGFVEFSDKKYIYAPRDCFDKNGRFIQPDVIATEEIDPNLYCTSIRNSVLYFIKTVINQGTFSVNDFCASIETTELLFED